MAEPRRKIAALLAADVVGYTRLMEADESRTLAALKVRREIFARLVGEHGGREFGCVGDSLMAEFPSAVNAVLCAVAIQRAIQTENEPLPPDQRMLLRMGLNLGDVIEEHGMLYGDGVNLAARLQTLAAPGGICLAGSVYEQVKHRRSIEFKYAGLHSVKNVSEPVVTYQVAEPGVVKRDRPFWSELRRRNVPKVGVAYSILAWLTIELVMLVPAASHAGAWLVRALALLAGAGLPLVLYLAWRYELTPSGLRRSEAVLRQHSITRLTGRRLDGALVGLLMAAAVFLVFDHFAGERYSSRLGKRWMPSSTPILGKSIAVLPFDNKSLGVGDAAFFADGVHDDLLTLLSKLGDMRVISRTSVERYRNSEQGIREIADALGVSTILEGTVRLAGDSVRVNVQLIDATSEADLWAETYDRELTAKNVFGIQSELAARIADSLQVTLSSVERRRLAAVPTQNLEAYETYLRGKEQLNRRTVDSVREAVARFRRAIELDPGFALAYVGVAESYAVLQDWGHLPREDVQATIREAATRALELDDQLGEAYVSLAAVYDLDRDYRAAGAAYERALELNPGYATARSWYRDFLMRIGRWEEAVEQGERAVRLDPLSPLLRAAFGLALSAVGRFDEALSQFEKARDLDPDFAFAYHSIGDHYAASLGRLDEAFRWYRRAASVSRDPEWIGEVGGLYLMLGADQRAEEWIERARQVAPENVFVCRQRALLEAYRGDDARAESAARNCLGGPVDVDMAYMLFVLRNADLRAGRYADARLRYEEMYPSLAEEDPVVHRSNYRAAVDLSVVLEEMGEPARAQQMLEKSLSVVRTMPRLGPFGYGIADAEIHALRGEGDAALSALRSAVDEGWRLHWYLWTERNPNLEAIADTEEYRAVIAELASEMAAQLQRIADEDVEAPFGTAASVTWQNPGRAHQDAP